MDNKRNSKEIDLILERVCQQHALYTRDRKTGSVIIHVHYLDGVVMAIETAGAERTPRRNAVQAQAFIERGNRDKLVSCDSGNDGPIS